MQETTSSATPGTQVSVPDPDEKPRKVGARRERRIRARSEARPGRRRLQGRLGVNGFVPELHALEARVLMDGSRPAWADFGRSPMGFAANTGQADLGVQYLAHGAGYGLLL